MSNTRRTTGPRKPRVTHHEGEGRQLGLDDRDIPSGEIHFVNPETIAAKPKKPAVPKFEMLNAHGVEPGDAELERPEAGEILESRPVHEAQEEDYAVPVYMVEKPGKGNVRRDINAEVITVPGNTADPQRLCSVDPNRVQISILNEDAANDARFSQDISTVVEGRGAILPHAASSYRTLKTQGELWILGASANAVHVSVIIETEVSV